MKMERFKAGAFSRSTREQDTEVRRSGHVIEDGDSQEFILHGTDRQRRMEIRKDVSVKVTTSTSSAAEEWEGSRGYY